MLNRMKLLIYFLEVNMMLRISKSTLTKVNYVLIISLLMVALTGVLFSRSPEKLIQGEWEEVGWYFEKSDYNNKTSSQSGYINEQMKLEIFDQVVPYHMNVWHFAENGSILSEQDTDSLQWYIKGRGHILELRKDGRKIESFQIQNLTRDKMELHFNLDLQVKGVVKIVLKRKELENNYAKKV
ncbi:Uncharacterised protein [Sphingobacterium spiritivorum]|nr:Uncharacterised protein [Sphingobacterium spiritivorum]